MRQNESMRQARHAMSQANIADKYGQKQTLRQKSVGNIRLRTSGQTSSRSRPPDHQYGQGDVGEKRSDVTGRPLWPGRLQAVKGKLRGQGPPLTALRYRQTITFWLPEASGSRHDHRHQSLLHQPQIHADYIPRRSADRA